MSKRTNNKARTKIYRILAVCIVVVIILVAAVFWPKPTNKPFVDNARRLLEITAETTREEVEKSAYERTLDTKWLVDEDLGSYIDNTGRRISIELNSTSDGLGETIYHNGHKAVPVVYPTADPLAVEEIISGGGKTHTYIYGTKSTVSRIMAKKEVVQSFADEYFADSKAPVNLLHLIFTPTDQLYDFTRVPALAKAPSQNGQHMQSFGFIYVWWMKPGNGDPQYIVGTEVYLRFHAMEKKAQILGMSKRDTIVGVISNEMINVFAEQQINTNDLPNNEAYSTISCFVASMDPETAALILGGQAYKDFAELMASEMDKLAER